MKRFFLTIALFATMAVSINAQLLWRVTAPSDTTVASSYLVGTHHIAPAGMIDSISGLREAISEVSTVYGELDMSELSTPQGRQLMMKYIVAPADSTLDKVLTPAQIDSVNTILKTYTGMDGLVSQMLSLVPAVTETQIGALQTMKALPGFDASQQLDMQIQTIAASLGMKIAGLETPDFQYRALFGIPVSLQAQSLMKSVRMDDVAVQKAAELAGKYLAGDLDGMMEVMNDPATGMDEPTAKRLIDDRNQAWADILIGAIPTASVLVAVGAGHLPGVNGLIAKLRDAGFKVDPVGIK